MAFHPKARLFSAIIGGSIEMASGIYVGGVHTAAIGGTIALLTGLYVGEFAMYIVPADKNRETYAGITGGTIAGLSAASLAVYIAKNINEKYMIFGYSLIHNIQKTSGQVRD